MGLIGASVIMFIFRSNTLAAVRGNRNSEVVYAGSGYTMDWYAKKLLLEALVLGFLGIIFFCVVFANLKHIKTAINVIDAAADFIIEHKRLIAVPTVYFLIIVGSLVLWFYTIGLVFSTNDIHTVSPKGINAYYKVMKWEV